VLAAAGALALTGAAIPAIATATSAPVVYNACVTIRTGAIKIVSAATRCAAGQRKISWNKVGPRGLTGLQGPIGQQGLDGPPGPPGVVTGYQASNGTPIAVNNTGFTVVDTLDLPAGAFLVTARAQGAIINNQSSDYVQCNLVDGSGSVVDFDTMTLSEDFAGERGPQGVENLTLNGITTSGGTVQLECLDATGQAAVGVFAPTRITAIPLDAVVGNSAIQPRHPSPRHPGSRR